jgi:hypothetical protein
MKENRIAAHSGLDPQDPRWVLAMQTEARLQGATLTPERREQLLRSGSKMGLRPFESNLVIAIVQDRAPRRHIAGTVQTGAVAGSRAERARAESHTGNVAHMVCRDRRGLGRSRTGDSLALRRLSRLSINIVAPCRS